MYYSSSPCRQECLNCWRPAVLLRREETALWGHFSLLPSTEQRPSTRGSYPADESSIHHEGPLQNPVPREAGTWHNPNSWSSPEFTHKAAFRSWVGGGSTVTAGYCWIAPDFPRPWGTRGRGGCPMAVLGCGERV